MRFKNFGTEAVVLTLKAWGLPATQGPQPEGVESFTVRQTFELNVEGPLSMTEEELAAAQAAQEEQVEKYALPDQYIGIYRVLEPGFVTEDFDPEDPMAKLMLKAHPELKPYVVPTVWERLVKPEPER